MRINSFNDCKYLETTYKTVIQPKPEDNSIKLIKDNQVAESPFVEFPATEIITVVRKRFCVKCKSLLKEVNGKDLLSCTRSDCSFKVLPSNSQSFYTVQALFTSCTITFFPSEVNKLINLTKPTDTDDKTSHVNDEDDLSILMMTLRKLKAHYNKKYVCIGFTK